MSKPQDLLLYPSFYLQMIKDLLKLLLLFVAESVNLTKEKTLKTETIKET